MNRELVLLSVASRSSTVAVDLRGKIRAVSTIISVYAMRDFFSILLFKELCLGVHVPQIMTDFGGVRGSGSDLSS